MLELSTPVKYVKRIGERIGAGVGQAHRIVQLAIGQQSAIGGDHRTVELEPQAAVEIEPQRLGFRFTRRIRNSRPVRPAVRY